MKSIMTIKSMVVLGMIVIFGLFSTSCNTMEGAGEDIEAAGEKIEDAAD